MEEEDLDLLYQDITKSDETFKNVDADKFKKRFSEDEEYRATMEDWLKEQEDDDNKQTEEAETELEEDFVLEEVPS